jgi:phosphoribosyl 1,2-cyclic phosphate phosphodiesterase
MKIQYLGTAAAEGIPAMFCNCETCKKSRALGSKNIRTRSQALIDGKILIDFPADTFWHITTNNVDLSAIHTCIITHNHADHLYPSDFENRKIGFAHRPQGVLTVFGTYPTYQKVCDTLIHYRMDNDNRVSAKRIEPFKPFESEGYKITPLKADHDLRCEPVFYMIEKDNKSILYAHDTGILPDETWKYLENNPVKFNLISLDCTEPSTGIYRGHMSLDSNKKVRQKLIDLKLADTNTRFIINHFSHNGKLTYDELVPIAEEMGFEVSYDGLCAEF